MKISLSKRIVSFVLCLTVLLAGFAYKPQKVEAVAVTASVIASVAAIMTACGVTYWAATQQDAIEYLGGKIDEYFNSLGTVPVSYEDWLGISAPSQLFDVVSGGVMRFSSGVSNKILDFVRWFNHEEGVESGGEKVGDLGGLGRYFDDLLFLNGGFSVKAVGDNLVEFTLNDVSTSHPTEAFASGIYFEAVSTSAVQVTLVAMHPFYPENLYMGMSKGWQDKNTEIIAPEIGSSASLSPRGDYCHLCLGFVPYRVTGVAGDKPWSGSFTFRIDDNPEDFITPDTASVTPSALVAVPEDLDDGESFDVAPSVQLAQGMSVEQASEAVLDGAASEDGLTSEGETAEGAVAGWGWLSDILSSIRDFVAGIAQTVLGIPQAISQAASDVITGVGNAISTALYNAFVPSEAAIDAFVATLSGNFDNHFSILSYPFSLLGRFVLEVVDAPGAHELVWPDIYEPFSGQRLIAAGSYNLDNALANENFRTAYDIYMTVIKGYIAFQFIAYLYAWFCDVFRMRNDDYANPIFEQEPIDDGPDDWDGYDSFFET